MLLAESIQLKIRKAKVAVCQGEADRLPLSMHGLLLIFTRLTVNSHLMLPFPRATFQRDLFFFNF